MESHEKAKSSSARLTFEATGPHEPVTTRIKNILREYKEGNTIFKEFVQNADDSRATEVKFLLDWRENERSSVLSPAMASCQGPALWVYNNETFTDDDFVNISKLAGATKLEEPKKIGRFGLGFNTVYHLTDVPSFVSREFMLIFDPNTTHLGNYITNKSEPGVKIDLRESYDFIKENPDQFMPFHDVFGCEIKKDFYYSGTLFRFPFRTPERAMESKVSNKVYDRPEIEKLAKHLKDCCHKLLLFTQHVSKISFFEFDPATASGCSPANARCIFSVQRSLVEKLFNTGDYDDDSSFLGNAAEWFEGSRDRDPPKESDIITMNIRHYRQNSGPMEEGGNEDTKLLGEKSKETWVRYSCVGEDLSLQLAESEQGRRNRVLPCAGVAAKLCEESSLSITEVDGEAFTFLPLSITTGLPIHVNSYFSLTSNRRAIWDDSYSAGGQQDFEVKWNHAVIDDALSTAYYNLIEIVAKKQKQEFYLSYPTEYTCLWPNPSSLTSIWSQLVTSTYKKIIHSTADIVCSRERWLGIRNCKLLNQDDVSIPHVEGILEQCGHDVALIPGYAVRALQKVDHRQILSSCMVSDHNFLKDTFFPNISKTWMSQFKRDEIICHMLDNCFGSSKVLYESLLKDRFCIPCSYNGKLAKPEMLLDPTSDYASLFTSEDCRYPYGHCFQKFSRRLMLQNLGMKSRLTWVDVCERAESVANLDYQSGLTRVKLLFKYIEHDFTHLGKISESQKLKLQETKFLPVRKKPERYCLQWKGSSMVNKFVSAQESILTEHMYLLGSSWPVVHDSGLTLAYKVKEILGFTKMTPRIQDVIYQLEEAIKSCNNFSMTTDCVESVCRNVYSFLQETMDKEHPELEELKKQPCVLINGRFFLPSQLAFSYKKPSLHLLCEVPFNLKYRFHKLFLHIGVKERFVGADFVWALEEMKKKKGDSPLDEKELDAAKSFLEDLADLDDWEEGEQEIYLPNEKKILQTAGELIIPDVPWISKHDQSNYVHWKISSKIAHRFGAHTIREASAERLGTPLGTPFGQTERLTDRLRGILRNYPCDVGILKELVQNADDAQASKIHFIYDKRHLNEEKVFSDRWKKELLGPALCVYNDKPFTEEDFKGIQRLGVGSKSDDPTKTGQYGIGFNAVYHLTDVPQLLSNNNTLCVFDPLLQYIPGATTKYPGRKYGPLDKKFRNDFAGIFNGFLGSFFNLNEATMFRFPLRSQEQANSSGISSHVFDKEGAMDDLFQYFKKDAREMLLFLNHVQQIVLWEITPGGRKKLHEVSMNLTSENESKRQQMAKVISSAKKVPTSTVPYTQISYTSSLSVDSHSKEEWVISRCVGVNSSQPKPVINGAKMGLLPHAGVAARLSPGHSSVTGRAFCTLPLPVHTGLPVHVNGHFVLDHARREIWKDEVSLGKKGRWNDFIKTSVLAFAYLGLLEAVKELIFSSLFEKSKNPSHSEVYFLSERAFQRNLDLFNGLFPDHSFTTSDWKSLVETVYRNLIGRSILPVMVNKKDQLNMPLPRGVYVCRFTRPEDNYFHVLKKGKKRTKEHSNLKEILKDIGMPIAESPQKIFESFGSVDVEVRTSCPSEVVKFLKSYTQMEQTHFLGNLPCPLSQSTLHSKERFMTLINHCMRSETFLQTLQDLPLLLTEKKTLSVYTWYNPVFLSHRLFHELLPDNPELFQEVAVGDSLREEFCSWMEDKLKGISVFKEFNIQTLAPIIGNYLPQKFHYPNGGICWDPNYIPTSEWMYLFWSFVVFWSRRSRKDKNILDPLMDWALIPVCNNLLITPREAHKVMDFHSTRTYLTPQVQRIVDILQRLQCPQVDYSRALSDSEETNDLGCILEPYVSHPSCPRQVLGVISEVMTVDGTGFRNRLNPEDAVELLMFFQDDKKCDMTSLRKLPFYKSAFEDKLVQIESYDDVFVLPDQIPRDELDIIMQSNHVLLLKSSLMLKELYKRLDIKDIGSDILYAKMIFPHFASLKQVSRIKFLEDIMQRVLPYLESNNESDRFLESMKYLHFMPSSSTGGELKPACAFVDPEIKVFKLMTPDQLPPSPFDSEVWVEFLRKIGLRNTISKSEIISFANEIASSASKQDFRHENLEEKSKELVEYLLNEVEQSLFEDLFKDISQIRFIAPPKVDDVLDTLLPYECRSFSSFNGAVLHEYETISWINCPLLPDWINQTDVGKERLEMLGVLFEPSVETVCETVRKLCVKYCDEIVLELEDDVRSKLNEVLKDAYEFLEENLQCDSRNCEHDVCTTVAKTLKEIKCIVIDDGKSFITGSDLVFQLLEEIPPYLHKVPSTHVRFRKFLKQLGVEEEAHALHYTHVLQKMEQQFKENEFRTNDEMCNCKKAVRGLFQTLHQSTDLNTKNVQSPLSDLEVLFLPTTQFKYLKPSVDLIFNDCPEFTTRVSGMLNEHLVDLRDECFKDSMQTTSKLLVELLPGHLLPKSLSTIVQQTLLPESLKNVCQEEICEIPSSLENRLKSKYFVHGMLLLLKQEKHQTLMFDDQREKIVSLLKRLTITCVNNVRTQLVYKTSQEPVKGSEQDDWFHYEETDRAVRLFVKHGETRLIEISLAEFLAKFFQLSNTTETAFMIAAEDPSEIPNILKNRGIKENEYPEEESEISEGKRIPCHCLRFLNQNIKTNFRCDDIVGIEQCDEDEECFIYGKIIREMTSDCTPQLERQYLVDIGEKIEVSVLDMYDLATKLENNHDNEENGGRASPPVDGDAEKEKVRKLLEEARELSEENRRKVIKRMYMLWHPDKNPNNAEVCTEVTKFILSEVKRMSGEKSHFCDVPKWDTIACKHNATRDIDFDIPARPNKMEAVRWLKQCKVDMDAARFSEEKKYYADVCFHCHQVAEKSMKGAIYGVIGTHGFFYHHLHPLACMVSEFPGCPTNIDGLVSVLDSYYIKARYPDSHGEGLYPSIVYNSNDASSAIFSAETILNGMIEVCRQFYSSSFDDEL